MNDPWWRPHIQWTIWGLAMALIMGWVSRSRLKARPGSKARQLVHPPSTLIVGVLGLLFFGGIAIVSNVRPNKTTTWWTTTLFVGFALLSLPLIADYFLGRHEVSEEGLNYGRWSGLRGYLRWSELRRVNYAPGMKWFRLETQSGDVARVSAALIGLPKFASLLLAHAPREAIEAGTLMILEETAAGNPPPVWG